MADPELSVVVPAHNAEGVLPHCLAALLASDLPRSSWELIVVDDASSDRTSAVAEASADNVISLEAPPRGPAFARNRGFDAARGALVAFVDADVCVHADVLRRFVELLTADQQLAGVFGSYDDEPFVRSFVSQYRNLLHHYVHQHNGGYARSFWAGCGAVRGRFFVEAGKFDERRYLKPQIEDVELGLRIQDNGHKLLLEPSILATHRKGWSLAAMLWVDFSNRGVPWMHLLLERGELLTGEHLSVGKRDRLSAAAVALLIVSLIALLVFRSPLAVLSMLAFLLFVFMANLELISWYSRKRGVRFAAGAFGTHLLYHATNVASALYGLLTHFTRSPTSTPEPVAK